MISNVFTLKESNVIPSYFINVETTKIEENYYLESSLEFLKNIDKEIMGYKRDFYKVTLECDNKYIINEAFSDVVNKIKEIIKKILAYINSIIKRFVTKIAKFVNSDKYIVKMKKELDKFTERNNFTRDGYIFTFNDNIPNVNIYELDLSKVRSELSDLKDKPTEAKKSSLLATIAGLLSEDNMDSIRGQILSLDYPISSNSFENTCFSIYRDGKSDEVFMTIDKNAVMKAYKDFTDYKDKLNSAKRTKDMIEKKYKDFENQIDIIVKSEMKLDGSSITSMVGDNVSTTNYTVDLKLIIDKLINAYTTQIQKIASLHTIAFSSKLDALGASFIQNKDILYKALSIVQGDLNNIKTVKESIEVNYNRGSAYRNYINECLYLDLEQKRFVNECLALSNSKVKVLQTIHEDLKTNIKELYEKLVTFIKNMFSKFTEKMDSYIKSDESFLTKYKDVILNKKIEKYTIDNMPPYSKGIKNITNGSIPKKLQFNTLIEKSENEIYQEVLPGYKAGDTKFSEFATRFFLCNNEEGKDRNSDSDPEINMKDIYEFCVNAKSALENIKKDQSYFESEVKKIQDEVVKAVTVKESTINDLGDIYYYSSILESYINENGDKKEEDKKETQIEKSDDKAKDNAKDASKIDFMPSREDKDSANKDIKDKVSSYKFNKDEAEKQANDMKNSKSENANSEKIKETGSWYLKALQTTFLSKITAFQKIYTEYMKILRYHVRTAGGKDSSTLTDEDKKKIGQEMLNYYKETDGDKKNEIAEKIIAIYKSRDISIDRHDLDNIISKNKEALEKQK